MENEKRTNTSKRKTVQVPFTDLEFIKSQLEALSQGQEKTEGKLHAIDNSVRDLNNCIVGNKNYGQVGVLEKLDEHEKYIEKDKMFKHKIIGGTIVLGVIWSYVLKIITK